MLKADFKNLRIISEADVRDLGFRNQREFYYYVILYANSINEANKMINCPDEIFMINRYANLNQEHIHLVEQEMIEEYINFQKDILNNYQKIYTINPELDNFISSILSAPSVFKHWKEPYPTGRLLKK